MLGGVGYGIYRVVFDPVRFGPGDWRDRATPDGGCTVQIPGPVQDLPLSGGGPGIEGRKYQYIVPGRDAAFMFGYMDVAAHIAPADYFDRCYRAELDEVGKALRGQLVRDEPVDVNGHEAREAEFKPSTGGRVVYRMVLLRGPTKARFVMLFCGGRNMSAADRRKFLDSFQIKFLP